LNESYKESIRQTKERTWVHKEKDGSQ
jgi:hypothetical protein